MRIVVNRLKNAATRKSTIDPVCESKAK